LSHSQAAQYVENGVQGPSSLYRKFQLEMPLLLHPRILSTLSLASHTCGIDGPACVLPVFPEYLSLFNLGVNGRRMAELRWIIKCVKMLKIFCGFRRASKNLPVRDILAEMGIKPASESSVSDSSTKKLAFLSEKHMVLYIWNVTPNWQLKLSKSSYDMVVMNFQLWFLYGQISKKIKCNCMTYPLEISGAEHCVPKFRLSAILIYLGCFHLVQTGNAIKLSNKVTAFMLYLICPQGSTLCEITTDQKCLPNFPYTSKACAFLRTISNDCGNFPQLVLVVLVAYFPSGIITLNVNAPVMVSCLQIYGGFCAPCQEIFQ
ncbi:hypothetical protein DBR06_SOUSAS33810011, partial [Sousa chinensis]